MAAPRKYTINIGDTSGHHPNIKVVGKCNKLSLKSGRSVEYIIVRCDRCSLDAEMYGDGCFKQSVYDYLKGRVPCGCSVHPKRTYNQWQTVLNRAAISSGLEYRGYVGEWIGNSTKVLAYCKEHDFEYNTTLASNFIKGTACPKCGHDKVTTGNIKPDHVFTDRWRTSGAYPEGTTFKRLTNRLWELTCPLCIDEVFISYKSNLDAGKRPCKCVVGGGYNKELSGYLYILKVDGIHNRFTGFGISNFFNKRLAEHTRNLDKEGLSVVDSYDYFFEDGCIPRGIESAIKSKFPLARQEIAGFKTEATHYNLFLDVRNFVEDYIENVAK